MLLIKSVIFSLICGGITTADYSFIDLPERHLPYYFNNFPNIAKQCLNDRDCEYKDFLLNDENTRSCWGYETDCAKENAFNTLKCPGDHTGWVQNKQTQLDTFYTQADFGYIKDQLSTLRVMCEPLFKADSALECSEYLRYCRGRNLMMNFTDLVDRPDPYRYKMDVLKEGQVAGHCTLHEKRLKGELDHVSVLQSWAPELRYFQTVRKRPIEGVCDIVVTKPTYIMKIDATNNMYHHFCDFFNLYVSLHINMSHPRSFSKDINILVWESFTYESPFSDAFKAFTDNPILDLKDYKGKVVCFEQFVLPLLPRMIFGLYYNTPLITGCENSALFHAFTEFMLHRLRIEEPKHDTPKIQITFLSRRTKYRRILNEEELLSSISSNPEYEVKRVEFDRTIPFRDQLKITRNTDILIGIHGAGLTHLLFLPNWATLFEIYHCEDPGCYKDLARLRGVNYVTWEDETLVFPEDEGHHPEGGRHMKFTNYSFDKDEFVRLVEKSANHVREHSEFKESLKEIQEEHEQKDEL